MMKSKLYEKFGRDPDEMCFFASFLILSNSTLLPSAFPLRSGATHIIDSIVHL
jgi:hypothetical protein